MILLTVFTTITPRPPPPWGKNLDPRGEKSKSVLKLELQTECEVVDLNTTTRPVLCKGYFHAGLQLRPQTKAQQGFLVLGKYIQT